MKWADPCDSRWPSWSPLLWPTFRYYNAILFYMKVSFSSMFVSQLIALYFVYLSFIYFRFSSPARMEPLRQDGNLQELNYLLNWITQTLFELNNYLNWILVNQFWMKYWIASIFAEVQTLNWIVLGIDHSSFAQAMHISHWWIWLCWEWSQDFSMIKDPIQVKIFNEVSWSWSWPKGKQ